MLQMGMHIPFLVLDAAPVAIGLGQDLLVVAEAAAALVTRRRLLMGADVGEDLERVRGKGRIAGRRLDSGRARCGGWGTWPQARPRPTRRAAAVRVRRKFTSPG